MPGVDAADEEAEQPDRYCDEQYEPENVGSEPETSEDRQQQEQDY